MSIILSSNESQMFVRMNRMKESHAPKFGVHDTK